MKKIFLIFISALFLGGCNRLDNHQPLTSSVEKIPEGNSISQSFTSSRDNLNIVSICIRNPERGLIPLQFSLSENDREVRHIDFSSGNIDNEDCTKFQFSPILDSANHLYVARISSFPPDKDKLTPTVLTIEKYGDTLHYKTFYYQSLKEAVAESFSQFPPRIIADLGFFILWGAGLIFLLICLKK